MRGGWQADNNNSLLDPAVVAARRSSAAIFVGLCALPLSSALEQRPESKSTSHGSLEASIFDLGSRARRDQARRQPMRTVPPAYAGSRLCPVARRSGRVAAPRHERLVVEIQDLDRQPKAIGAASSVCQDLMNIPGVGCRLRPRSPQPLLARVDSSDHDSRRLLQAGCPAAPIRKLQAITSPFRAKLATYPCVLTGGPLCCRRDLLFLHLHHSFAWQKTCNR
jgi:hypothetical protein